MRVEAFTFRNASWTWSKHLGIVPPLATCACRNLHIIGLSDLCKGMFAAAQTWIIHSWQIFTFSICAKVLQFNTVVSVCCLMSRFRSALCLCNAESRCLWTTDFQRWSITILHDKQNISPWSTWNIPVGYFLAWSWAVRLGERWKLAFLDKETVVIFTKTDNFAYIWPLISNVNRDWEGNCIIQWGVYISHSDWLIWTRGVFAWHQ